MLYRSTGFKPRTPRKLLKHRAQRVTAYCCQGLFLFTFVTTESQILEGLLDGVGNDNQIINNTLTNPTEVFLEVQNAHQLTISQDPANPHRFRDHVTYPVTLSFSLTVHEGFHTNR